MSSSFVGPSGNVLRGMAVLVAGSGTARLISLASIPILTRIYSPEDFGVLSVFTALLQILIPLATLHYLMAIPLPRHDQTAFALLSLCTILSTTLSVLIGIILFVFGLPILETFSLEVLAPWRWIIGPGMLGASSYQLLTMWATRKRSYRIIAKTQLFQSLTGEGIKLLMGIIAIKPLGLLIGQVAAYSGGLSNLLSCFGKDFFNMVPRLKLRHILVVARRYYGFPVYRLPAQFLLVLSMQAPLLFTTMLYGAETTGQLGLATMAVTLPFILLGQSVSRAYYAEAAELWRGDRPAAVQKLFKKTTLTLLIIILFPSIFLAFFSPLLSQILLGRGWEPAGKFISLLSITLVPQFISSSLLRTLDVLESNKTVFYLYLQKAVLTIIPFFLAERKGLNSYESILIYSLMMVVHYSLQYAITFFRLKKSIQQIKIDR
ncbi:lipopolysaccharide biosynthesis protein [Nodosilinea sp. E11]|uniref:lipopolysaccharide biosynthesis protein n=1 Tax=Nodosilinea sp. E11 TaxID=3037479 RepID=UPI002934A88A|nr:oligosaccharide flippase family protein [Nodosilinea sp. E11]